MAQYVFTMNRVGKIVPPKRQILKDVSLSFFPGAKIGVLGVNGSGKSTLLKILARVMYPYAGDVEVRGRVGALIEVRAGIHPGHPSLHPEPARLSDSDA